MVSDMTSPELKIHPSLEPFALGIGALCQEWAKLEESVLGHLLNISKMPQDKISEAILNCMNFRSQLTALKIAAVARFEHESCVNALIENINYRASCKILVFPRTFFSKQSCADTIRPFAVEIF